MEKSDGIRKAAQDGEPLRELSFSMAPFLEVCQTRHLRCVLGCGGVRAQKMDSFLWTSDGIRKVLSGRFGLARMGCPAAQAARGWALLGCAWTQIVLESVQRKQQGW